MSFTILKYFSRKNDKLKIAIKILKIRNLIKNLKNNIEVNYPLTESKKIILISLQKSRIAISECINLVLLLEVKNKGIKQNKNPKKNLENFFSNYSKNFDLSLSEIEKIKEILRLARAQRQSLMDFKRKKDIILLSNELDYKKIKMKNIEEYTKVIEIILQKILLTEKLKT
jgi:hypothetical protein